jgi:ferritin-like metal-binding protein YciE
LSSAGLKGDVMSKKLKHPRQLLVQELGDLLSTEETVERLLPEVAEEAKDERVVRSLQEHLSDTRVQIERLREILGSLDEDSDGKPSAGIEGLEKELRQLPTSGRFDEIGDLVLLGFVGRVEHYEIASYEAAIALARAVNESRIAELLSESLGEEKRMLSGAAASTRRLAPRAAKAAIAEVALSASTA